jgi:signal transduction histidine kinase
MNEDEKFKTPVDMIKARIEELTKALLRESDVRKQFLLRSTLKSNEEMLKLLTVK